MIKRVYFRNGKGFVVKRKAKKIHICHACLKKIMINTEYYQLNYYSEDTHKFGYTYPICEECWSGVKLNSENKRKYNEDLDEYASEYFDYYVREI